MRWMDHADTVRGVELKVRVQLFLGYRHPNVGKPGIRKSRPDQLRSDHVAVCGPKREKGSG